MYRDLSCVPRMEHRGVEPLTSTMPLWRATNCANAPCCSVALANKIHYTSGTEVCKRVEPLNSGKVDVKSFRNRE